MRPLPFAFKPNPREYKSMDIYKSTDINREWDVPNREWHVQYQYLLMEIAHAVNALHNGNNEETIVALHSKKIATNCATLVDLQDTSTQQSYTIYFDPFVPPPISARRVQWQSFIEELKEQYDGK